MAKKGVALPATHGLRTAVERHKGRLTAELTKARVRRKLSTIEALKAHIETGLESATDGSEAPHPRWVRINTLKTTLKAQLNSTFKGYDQVQSVNSVRQRGTKRVHIDQHIPNLIAVSPSVDLSKSSAYKSGEIIFQDKASCFPAYLLDPLLDDGDLIDTCSAPGNKTTHLAALVISHTSTPGVSPQVLHAFEKNKGRAETLEKMVKLAGSDGFTKLHPGQDFLKTDPSAPVYKRVGALLLDPSCSGSGIVGRDEMPELHLPVLKQAAPSSAGKISKGLKKGIKGLEPEQVRKRKREDQEDLMDVMVDDDGAVTAVTTEEELKARLAALSAFQLELLLHAFKYPAAKKITYSTCSIHAEENEMVVVKALESDVAKERGWRLLKRNEQVRGMKQWPVRGSQDECGKDIAEACIRANKGDEHGTMGFFLAGFVRGDIEVKPTFDGDSLQAGEEEVLGDITGDEVIAEAEDSSNKGREKLDVEDAAEEVLAAPTETVPAKTRRGKKSAPKAEKGPKDTALNAAVVKTNPKTAKSASKAELGKEISQKAAPRKTLPAKSTSEAEAAEKAEKKKTSAAATASKHAFGVRRQDLAAKKRKTKN